MHDNQQQFRCHTCLKYMRAGVLHWQYENSYLPAVRPFCRDLAANEANCGST